MIDINLQNQGAGSSLLVLMTFFQVLAVVILPVVEKDVLSHPEKHIRIRAWGTYTSVQKCCFGFITTSPATFLTLKLHRHLAPCSQVHFGLCMSPQGHRNVSSLTRSEQKSLINERDFVPALARGLAAKEICPHMKTACSQSGRCDPGDPPPPPLPSERSPLTGCRSVLLCFDFVRLIMWCGGSGYHNSCRTTVRCDQPKLEAQMQMSQRECAALLVRFSFNFPTFTSHSPLCLWSGRSQKIMTVTSQRAFTLTTTEHIHGIPDVLVHKLQDMLLITTWNSAKE